MKLIYCYNCGDIFTMAARETKCCRCRAAWCTSFPAEAIENCLRLEISGTAIPIALDSNYLAGATKAWLYDRRTSMMSAWTIDTTQERNDVVKTDEKEEDYAQ